MKNNLSPKQKEVILSFFTNPSHSEWKSIANKLIDTGEAIVAGDECIWNGGIGNFIRISTNPDYFGCLVYKFDLSYFLKSGWCREHLESIVEYHKIELEKYQLIVTELNKLL